MSNEIVFKPDVAMESATRADFTCKITPNTVSIIDTTLGKRRSQSYFGSLLVGYQSPKGLLYAGSWALVFQGPGESLCEVSET
jgi:hypothetical protein